MLDGRREQFAAEVAAAEGLRRTPRSRRRRRDRPHRLVRGLGRQVRAGRRLRQPGRRAVLQLLAARADGRRRDRRAAGLEPARLRERARPGALHRQHRRDRRLGAPAAAGDLARRGARHLRSAGRRRERADRLHGRARALAREPPRRQRDRPHGRRRRPSAPSCSAPRPTTSSASTSRATRTGPPSPASSGCRPSSRRRPSGTRSASSLARGAGAAARVAICSACGGWAWSTWSVVWSMPKRSSSSARRAGAGSRGSRSRARRARAR